MLVFNPLFVGFVNVLLNGPIFSLILKFLMKTFYAGILVYLVGLLLFIFMMETLKTGDFLLEMFDKSQEKVFEGKSEEFLVKTTKTSHRAAEHIEPRTELKPENSITPLKLSKEELGRNTWAMLHSMASAFPSVPSEENRNCPSREIFC